MRAGRSATAAWIAALWLLGATAHAGDRAPEQWREAYREARAHVDALDLEAAIASVDAALDVAAAEGHAEDPTLAPLLALKAAVMVALGADASASLPVLRKAVTLDYGVSAPVELRSAEFEALRV